MKFDDLLVSKSHCFMAMTYVVIIIIIIIIIFGKMHSLRALISNFFFLFRVIFLFIITFNLNLRIRSVLFVLGVMLHTQTILQHFYKLLM